MDNYLTAPTQGYYGESAIGQMKMASVPTLKQRLDKAVEQAEAQLEAVKEARGIFERNPDIERLLDLMQRSHF